MGRTGEEWDSLFHELRSIEDAIRPTAEKKVMIENAINLRLICDYVVSCSYADVVFIISMLRDYVSMLDQIIEKDYFYQAHYRNKFLEIANRLSEQIEYDYDTALQKCMKKQAKEAGDVGEDAMALAVKRGSSRKNQKETKK